MTTSAVRLSSAAGKTLFSFLTCRNWWTRGALFTGWTFPASFFDTIGDRGTTYPCLNYSCPQIRHIVGMRDGMEYDQAVVTFLVRASRRESSLMSDDRNLTKTGVGLVFFNEYSIAADVSGMSYLRNITQDRIQDSSLIDAKLSEQAGKGELWYTAVPWVRCAVLTEAEPYATVLAKGDHLAFNLMLRNEGNCYLSGVELSVAEVGHEPFGKMRLDFSEGNTLESEWNPRGDDGKLQNVEYDWALAPGMSSRYHAEYVTIPDDWEGEKEVEVYISAVYATGMNAQASGGALSAQAEDASIEYIPDQRIRGFLFTGGNRPATSVEGTYGAADVTVIGESSGVTKPSPGKSGIPSTGDALSLAALAAVGAVGASAAHRALKSKEESKDEESI